MLLEMVARFLLLAVFAAVEEAVALTPLRASPNIIRTLYGRVLGPGEKRSLRTYGQPVRNELFDYYRDVSTSFGEESKAVKRIQTVLDEVCQKYFADLCKLGIIPFCNGDAVARYGAGKAGEKHVAWRCYAEKTLASSGGDTVQCVDDCGAKFPCTGVVNSTTLFMTLNETFHRGAEKIATETCPSRQKRANDFCKSFGNDFVARMSATPKSADASWRCFKTATLLFNKTSQCVGHCTRNVQCPGGIPANARLEDVVYYTRTKEILASMAHEDDPCPSKKCTETSTKPVCS